ncbi:hypothetical protein VP14_103 [Vibrio phage VPMCC14]|nr:hypothetical protein VP14_103 [Vibrio phage VPMCC14]
MEEETYQERLENGVGNNIVRLSGNKSDNGYHSSMDRCHFRNLNTGINKFSLIETDTPSTFTFHMENIFVTDVCVSHYIEIILRKEFNIISKIKAIKNLYSFWYKTKSVEK